MYVFTVVSRAPKGQLRVRFPQETVNISGNENSFIAAFFVQNFLPVISGLSEDRCVKREQYLAYIRWVVLCLLYTVLFLLALIFSI